MFGGWGNGGGAFDDDAYDESDRDDRRRPLGLADALRCGLFLGPVMMLLGLILVAAASIDPQRHRYRAYAAAVDAWSTSGLAQFQAALPAGAASGGAPLTLFLSSPGSGDLLAIQLRASTALPPPTFNASRRERAASDAGYPALSFVGTAVSPFAVAWPSTAPAFLSLNISGGELLSTPVAMVNCSDTVGLQEGIDCSADSPPAPAPGQATDENNLLMDLERRRRRLLQEGRRRGRRSALQLMQSFVPGGAAAAPPEAADPGAVLGSDVAGQQEAGGTSRDSTAQDGVALSNAWATGAADGEVEKPRPTTCHGCGCAAAPHRLARRPQLSSARPSQYDAGTTAQ